MQQVGERAEKRSAIRGPMQQGKVSVNNLEKEELIMIHLDHES